MKQCKRAWLLILFSLLYLGCIDPVAPEFQFVDELLIIEGQASSTPGASSVVINRTSSEFGIYRNIFQPDAQVTFENLDSGEVVNLEEQIDVYVPPRDFVVSPGSTWQLNVLLSNGNRYRSLPEKVLASVPISDISATYEKELFFREGLGKFIAGHSLSINLEDAVNEKNYYFWRFRSFEKLILCRICTGTILRNGNCIPDSRTLGVADYFTYPCDASCWTIRYNESIEILDDEFINGNTVNTLPIANIPLYTTEDILVSLEQVSLSFDAYQYYKRLKDIVDNNGNFDAPPPAAVIGNLFNPNDDDEIILGRFTATSSSTVSIFIDRSDILEKEIDPRPPLSQEPYPLFSPNITFAPCIESRFRTGIEPEGWIEN